MAVNDRESEGLHLPAFMPLHQISLLEGHSRGHLSTGVPPSPPANKNTKTCDQQEVRRDMIGLKTVMAFVSCETLNTNISLVTPL